MKTFSFLRQFFGKLVSSFVSFFRQLFCRCNGYGMSHELHTERPLLRESNLLGRRCNLKQVSLSPEMYGLWRANHPHRKRACVSL